MSRISGAQPANVDKGVLLTIATIVINGVLGWYLITSGRRTGSLILVSNGKHVLTDSWTSLGAIIGLALVHFTGWPAWDPICGLIMAGNIIVSGYGLLQQSISGLMDVASPELHRRLNEVLKLERSATAFRIMRSGIAIPAKRIGWTCICFSPMTSRSNKRTKWPPRSRNPSPTPWTAASSSPRTWSPRQPRRHASRRGDGR